MIDESDEDSSKRRFRLQGRPVLVNVGSNGVKLIIQGPVPNEAAIRIVDAIRVRAEGLIQQACVFEEV
jgi:hypothetical protein